MFSSRRRRIFLAGCVGLLLFDKAAFSQEPACLVRQLPVSFRDAQNLPIQDISIADLEAKVHGQSVKLLSLAPDPRPHRIVLMVDTSGSMGKLWKLELSLARHFFDVNRKKSRIALLFFNNRVTDAVNFAQGNSAVGDMLQQVLQDHNYSKNHIRGRTALRHAILQGIQLLDQPSSADAVYVLTDGGDNASHETAKQLDKRLAATSVRLFAVLFFNEALYSDLPPEEAFGPADLAEITRRSGGEILTSAGWQAGSVVAFGAKLDSKSEETLSRLYETILQNSILEIQLPFPNAKNEHWEVQLSEEARRKWKGAHITYPATLVSCDSEVADSGRH